MEDLHCSNSQEFLQTCLQRVDYKEILLGLDIIAIGREGLEVLIQLHKHFPHLKGGYVYPHSLRDEYGEEIDNLFVYIPLMTDAEFLYKGTLYHIKSINYNAVHNFLFSLSDNIVIIGAMHDPTVVKLLDFYAFNQKNLILRRPMYFETTSMRPFIDKYLRHSTINDCVRIIDSIKADRYLKRLGNFVTMRFLYDEAEAHYIALVTDVLSLNPVGDLNLPILRTEAILFGE